MKKILMMLLLLAGTMVSAVEFEVETAVNSQYVWRGMLLNENAVFQPGITFSHQGFSLNVWSNMDLTDDYDHEFEFNELDYTLSYDWSTSAVSWSTGLISYTFPNTEFTSTMEAYIGFSLDKVRFNPSATLYYDFDEVEGFYLELSGSHEFETGLCLGLKLGYASEDYVAGYFVVEGEADGSFTDYAVTLDYPVALKYGELNFNVTWSNLVDSDLHSPGFEADDGNLTVGVCWSHSF